MSNDFAKRNRLIAIGGLVVCGVVTLIFVTLQLTRVIHWRWVNVFAPAFLGIVFAWDSIRRTKRKG
jgi:hypothetical protein